MLAIAESSCWYADVGAHMLNPESELRSMGLSVPYF